MDLFEAFRTLPLGSIAIAPSPELTDGEHLVVGLLAVQQGLVVAQPGWSRHPSHCLFHVFIGEVLGEGPWRVGKAVLRVVEEGDFLAPSFNDFKARPAGVDDLEEVIVQLQQFAREMKLVPWLLPSLDDKCGSHLTYRDFTECGETWRLTRVDNIPKQRATYQAMRDLCVNVLDPVIDRFGPIELTYGFASSALNKLVHKNPHPNTTRNGDQHAGCELNRNGKPFCPRLGQGVDFRVPNRGALEVAHWIVALTRFDRLYFYADDRPFHVSFGPEHSRFTWRLPKLAAITGPR